MKIQCDVCNEDEASVYCTADEAALCAACDHRVHHANKLAGKHPRFSLLLPSPKDSPVCDICQDKRAFLFCQQDRAILCKDCDLGIHKVNQHTQNHNRFLLTGVKLSPTSSLYSSSAPPETLPTTKNAVVPDQQPPKPKDQKPSAPPKKPAAASVPCSVANQITPKTQKIAASATPNCNQKLIGSGHGSTTSSISEYLIEMLPGWQVEDFLDCPSNLSKIGDNDPLPFWEGDMLDGNGRLNNSFSPETMGLWVPQAPQPPAALPPPPAPQLPPPVPRGQLFQQFPGGSNIGFGGGQMINGSTLVFAPNNSNINSKITSNTNKSSRKWGADDGNCFTVPQISPSSTISKRSRTLW